MSGNESESENCHFVVHTNSGFNIFHYSEPYIRSSFAERLGFHFIFLMNYLHFRKKPFRWYILFKIYTTKYSQNYLISNYPSNHNFTQFTIQSLIQFFSQIKFVWSHRDFNNLFESLIFHNIIDMQIVGKILTILL